MLDPTARTRRLSLIRACSLLDAAMLIALVGCAVAGYRPGVHWLGPLHGMNFLLLVGLAADGATRRWWGWWFPALILVLAGPLGSLSGERRLRREAP